MSDQFTGVDWAVLFGYLALTTILGHYMGGKQATIKDFFAGGRSLPWWAVCGSIIATEISGVTFIGVPGGVMAANGDFTYMLWGIGSVIGRVIVGVFFVRVFYEDDIYSPYDYMGRRIKPQLKTLATGFFTVGSILGQSVRILVAALPLRVVTGLPFELCILIIGIFAVAWTLMGGMRTVIWTDVMQFLLFTFGGLLSLFWISGHIDGGWSTIWNTASEAGKTKTWAWTDGIGPDVKFTFWVAVIAVPFQNLTAFGVDQLNAQRMFCCKNAGEARKAIIWSSVGQALTYLMLLVGAALFTFYYLNPPEGDLATHLNFQKDGQPATLAEGGAPQPSGDHVFPIWIVSELPPGLAGLILAGIFAAAISSLDSILAALSQTTISLIHNPETKKDLDQEMLVRQSRQWVIIWGIALTLFTVLMNVVKEGLGVPILPLAFGMTSYTMGPLLGMFFCALAGKGSFRGLLYGACLSFLMTMFVRMDVWILVEMVTGGVDWLVALPTYGFNDQGKVVPLVGFFWMWPVGTLVTFAGGLIGAKMKH